MAKAPKRSQLVNGVSQRDQSKPVRGRFFVCPGSGFAHGQAYLPIVQGPKVRFMTCPYQGCQVKVFLRGAKWQGDDVGLTRDEIERINPNAVVLE